MGKKAWYCDVELIIVYLTAMRTNMVNLSLISWLESPRKKRIRIRYFVSEYETYHTGTKKRKKKPTKFSAWNFLFLISTMPAAIITLKCS